MAYERARRRSWNNECNRVEPSLWGFGSVVGILTRHNIDFLCTIAVGSGARPVIVEACEVSGRLESHDAGNSSSHQRARRRREMKFHRRRPSVHCERQELK